MSLTKSNSESAYPITPVIKLKPRFRDNSVFVYILVVNNNKYLSYVVDNILFRISVPDYPSRTVESNSLRFFWNFCLFCLLYIPTSRNSALRADFLLVPAESFFGPSALINKS